MKSSAHDMSNYCTFIEELTKCYCTVVCTPYLYSGGHKVQIWAKRHIVLPVVSYSFRHAGQYLKISFVSMANTDKAHCI